MQKNNRGSPLTWRPSATLENLKQRAQLIKSIRDFFELRAVLEVETPLLCRATVTDPYIESMSVLVEPALPHPYYLQTSPEYAMKRLLAAGSGAIYQICKAFRQEEVGRYHNPEFSLLEWYRPGFDHHQLMHEVDELLQCVLKTPAAEKISYAALFETYVNINPHVASVAALAACAQANHLSVEGEITDRDTWLQLLLSHCIEPHLGLHRPCFIYDFPVSQAALSRIQSDHVPQTAARFEVYFRGVEIANGFFELQDVNEQRRRFLNNLNEREKSGRPVLAMDEALLAALAHGLPDCAGVALGIDRLVMLALEVKHIGEVLSFDFARS